MSDRFSRQGHLMEHHCPRKKVLKLCLTNSWPVPRGHTWGMLIWFMVSVHCLHRDDYSGSLQDPSDTLKVTVGETQRKRSGFLSNKWLIQTSAACSHRQPGKLLPKDCVHSALRGREREREGGINTGLTLPPFHWSFQVLPGKVIFAVMYVFIWSAELLLVSLHQYLVSWKGSTEELSAAH